MGEGLSLFWNITAPQEGGGGDVVCTYLIVLLVILLALYLSLYLYKRLAGGRMAKKHPCKYCGHMVDAVSQCCGAPVEEGFMTGRCTKCGKETMTVCAVCRRELY